MVTVRDAATVMIVRDDPFSVFMLRRSARSVFVPGASVFPGGAVDPPDRHAAVTSRVVGLDDAAASRTLGLPAGGAAWWVAAVREAFEEAGLLLARDRATGAHPTASDARALATVRDALNAGQATARDLLEGCDLVVDARDLVVFSHWLTPVGPPRRYDTWFFVAVAPRGQEGRHDDDEAVHSEWVRPAEMLERAARGDAELIFPTLRSLEELARFDSSSALLAAARGAAAGPGLAPSVVADGSGERVRLPGDPDGPARGWTVPLVSRPELDRAAAVEGHVGVAP